MDGKTHWKWTGLAVLLLLAAMVAPRPALAQADAAHAATEAELAAEGKQLFNGQMRFSHNGPACQVCHNVNGGHGGTSGPNLTQIYQAIGPSGLNSVLTNWPVAAMRPLYISHTLSQHERDALAAFFAATEKPGGAANVHVSPAKASAAPNAANAATPEAAPEPQPLSPQQLAALAPQGEKLFAGKVRFANGGPACLDCHSAATIPFPNGGTLGPDLTHIYGRLGPDGVASALSTLYFPAMMPLYASHPLNPDEQHALSAFLQRANEQPVGPHTTTRVLGLAGILFLILLAITGLLGRRRLTGVRRQLLATAMAAPRRADDVARLTSARPSRDDRPSSLEGE